MSKAVLCGSRCLTQVDAVASSLNSNDALVLVTPAGSKLWMGQGSSDAEKNGAKKLATILGVNLSEIKEGSEGGVCTCARLPSN